MRFSLTSMCICHNLCGTADLKSLSTPAPCGPSQTQSRIWRGQGGGARLWVRILGGLAVGREGNVFKGCMTCSFRSSSQAGGCLWGVCGPLKVLLCLTCYFCFPSQTPLITPPPICNSSCSLPSRIFPQHTNMLSLPAQKQPSRPPSFSSTVPFLYFSLRGRSLQRATFPLTTHPQLPCPLSSMWH